MTILHPNPVSIRRFTWHPESRLLSADMSEVRGFGRVYDDACDEGLTVAGATGREVVLVVSHVEYDRRENEYKWWDLVPANPHDRDVIAGARIWND